MSNLKINWHYLSLSINLVFIISYLYPAETLSNGIIIGFPLKFLKLYNFNDTYNLFSTSHLSIAPFVVNVLIIYFVLTRTKN